MSGSSEEFRPLRLRGGRFKATDSGSGYPLEAVAELARYERLLLQVARGLWKNAHPSRVRAPKNFDDSLRLRLTAVEQACVVPVLQRREPGGNHLFDPDGWMERSQAMIAETVAAIVAEEPLPSSFPEAAMASLINFGSGLREDEEVVMSRNGNREVIYNQRARRHLITTAHEEIEVSDELVGRLTAIRANDQEFDFTARSGKTVPGRFSRRGLFSSFRNATDRTADAPFVRIVCTYTTDTYGNVTSVEDVDEVEVVLGPDDRLAPRLRELLELPDGWHDSEGRAPDVGAVERVRDFAAEITEELAVELSVFPTRGGGLLAERQIEARRWSLEIDEEGDVSIVIVSDEGVQTIEPEDAPEAADSLRSFVE